MSSNERNPFTQDFPHPEEQCDSATQLVQMNPERGISSAGERALHTRQVTGSTPVSPTKTFLLVPLSRGLVAKIDAEDALKVAAYKWSANQVGPGRFYAQTRTPDGRNLYLHRMLLNAPEGVFVDHRNRDTLDCRRANLRLADPAQNSANQRRSLSATGYCGVTLRRGFRYQAKIKDRNTYIHIGYFETAEEAARAYDAKAVELRGEYAALNFPEVALTPTPPPTQENRNG